MLRCARAHCRVSSWHTLEGASIRHAFCSTTAAPWGGQQRTLQLLLPVMCIRDQPSPLVSHALLAADEA